MRAEQKELDIEIHIVDDDCVEPDEDFRVMLMEAENENKKRALGASLGFVSSSARTEGPHGCASYV